MIKSDIIKIEFTKEREQIENALKTRGINPIRWAVVAVEKEKFLVLNVSYKI